MRQYTFAHQPERRAPQRVGGIVVEHAGDQAVIESNRAWLETTQPKFANLCIRVIAAQSKVPALPGTLEALAMDAIMGPLPEEMPERIESLATDLVTRIPPGNAPPRASALGGSLGTSTKVESRDNESRPSLGPSTFDVRPSIPASAPPARDCSPALSAAAPKAAEPPLPSAASRSATEPSSKAPTALSAARNAFLAPARSAHGAGDDLPVTELRITPQQLGLTNTKHLSRRERRTGRSGGDDPDSAVQ